MKATGVTRTLGWLRGAARRRGGHAPARADTVEQAGRWRDEETQRAQLREVVRNAGVRIRAHLRVEDVVNEARVVIESELGADAAYMHLVDEHGKFGLPIGHEHDWIMPQDYVKNMPTEVITWVEELFEKHASMVVQDVTGPEGEQLPPQVLQPMRAAGIVSHLLVPFGGGSEILGVIVALRFEHGRPWTQPEIEATESIAADIGRGLNHARLYEEEQRLVAELKSVDEMKTEFFATVAHELRQPLTAVEGYVQMLDDEEGGPVTDVQRGMLKAVARSAERMRNLIEELFTLAKLESSQARAATGPVDLAEIVSGATDEIRPAAEAGGLSLETSDLPHGLVIEGNADQLNQALVNLLSNAVKFTRRGGQIWVAAAAEGRRAVITVHDTGIGIPEQEREHLFSRFFRASNAVRQHIPGTGLGLAIVRAIVIGHSGEVDLRSQEDSGTTATMLLPLAGASHQPTQSATSND